MTVLIGAPMIDDKEVMKDFLRLFPYSVMHECKASDKKMEQFFVVIQKNHENMPLNPTVMSYLDSYTKGYPLTDVSVVTKNYIRSHNKDFFFVMIDTLDTSNTFYNQQKEFVMHNANNILSIKLIGEVADVDAHLSSNFDRYFSQFKEISTVLGEIAKEKVSQGIEKGRILFEEKSPVIKKNIEDFGSKLGDKLKAIKKKF
jgi:hypothetical protein